MTLAPVPRRRTPAATPRKRVLVVNCYFDDTRRPLPRTTKLPQAMGPVYLAGAFAPATCDVRLYNELSSGPLEDEQLLAWPDMLVMTGLTNSFDRMLHLSAYAKSKNPQVITVAGGPVVRQLPLLAARRFDYACTGDIEELREITRAALGPAYAAEEMVPRFDLAYWINWLGHVESTRYCNFHCGFCALTGEGHSYQTYDLEYLRRQITAVAPRSRYLLFIDNNFYGSDRRHFQARLALLRELRAAKQMPEWGALVTNDFFGRGDNLAQMRAAGCWLLFSGVESFDADWLRGCNKLQNTVQPQVEMISQCLDAGIVFCYGLILDPTSRRVADLRRELDFITGTPEITLPSFMTMSIPLLGTPYFFECLNRGALLPHTKLRDMDGLTILMETLDPQAEAVEFLRTVATFRGYRQRVLRHALGFIRRYRGRLSKMQLAAAMTNAALTCTPNLASALTSAGLRGRRAQPRTYVSTTEPLDAVYTPRFRVAARYESYFLPTMVTDEHGALSATMHAAGVLKEAALAV